MKLNRIFSLALTAAFALAVSSSALAASGETAGYSYLAGKVGRTEEALPYAGMLYEGGEQGDTSSYSFRTSGVGKPWNTAK